MKEKILILMGILTLIVAGNIWAEEEKKPKTKIIVLEPIIVTPLRLERRLSEVPYGVSIISEKEIEESDAKDVPDLLKDVEGIYTYDASGVGTAGRINMRGFWGGMSTHQLVLIDGIPQNKGEDKLVDWDFIPLDNIERIEIVRGPVSAVYGDNAMSGVINIITKKPSAIPETKISTSYGSYNTQKYKISTSGTFKTVGYYFGANRKSTDGFRKHCNYENIHLNGKLDLLIDDTQDLRLSLSYHRKERGAYPWALTEAQIETYRRQARPGTEKDEGEANKCNLGATYHTDIGQISNVEGTFYYRYEDNEAFYTSKSAGSSTEETIGDENTYGLLLRVNINPVIFGIKHSFTTGVDLERNDVDYKEYAAPYKLRSYVRNDYEVERYKIGHYLQGEVKFSEPLKFIGGIRYDLVKFDFKDHRDESNSKDRKMSSITPSCGIVYTYQEDSNLYGNYSQGFRTPTIGHMFTYGSYSNPDLDPEEATNYEMGVRHRFGDYLKANVSLYWMELDSEIQYDYAASKYENIGETSHRGIETSVDFEIIEGITGFFNYTYTRAKNESGSYKGNYLTNIPIHKGSLGMRFESDYGLKANLITTWVGSSYIDSANDDKLSGYATVDTKISYEHKRWTAFLAIDNLLNKKYNSYGLKSGTTRKFSPAPQRTFTFGMEAKF